VKGETMDIQPTDTSRVTPWGRADFQYIIAPGVAWVNTPGHSGFLIGAKAARKYLSEAALKLGRWTKQFYAFEEDVLASVVLFERPEWAAYLGIQTTPEELVGVLSYWHLDYLHERGITPTTPLTVWASPVKK
jgi:hypothetical protein